MVEICCYFHDFPAKTEILDTLSVAGIRVKVLKKGATGGGLLFFKEITGKLLEVACEISRGGLERTIAVSSSSAIPDDKNVWQLLNAGACDVLVWDQIQQSPDDLVERLHRWARIDELIACENVANKLVGKSWPWRLLLRRIVEIARFSKEHVLLIGETGTGKELVAQLIHDLDPRAKKPALVVLDCTTIMPQLSGSEFFGHERGAFTGALFTREGAFALANGGTLFLDEIGELTLELQAQLLRAIQEGTYKRVGGNNWHHTSFRLICATNKDLLQEVKANTFRHDLYYRISGWTCRLPSLHSRSDDIIPLARHFMKEYLQDDHIPELSQPVRTYLRNRSYPGNVRELEQLVYRMMDRHVGPGPVTVGDIPKEEWSIDNGPEREWRTEHFKSAIRHALLLGLKSKEIILAVQETLELMALAEIGNEKGQLKRVAEKLGVTERALQMRRKKRLIQKKQ